MMKVIKDLKWHPRWVTHLGCIEGSLKYLGFEISPGWLYGGTGHAFILNVAEDMCPSGPTAWRTHMLFQLAHHLGYEIKGIFAHKSQPDFKDEQKNAWEFVKAAIENGLPCYGWELEIPEFYVVNGYDEVGYYYSGPGCDDGSGPKRWEDVGKTGIGIIEMYSIQRVQGSEPEIAVRNALEKVLHHSTNPEEWIFDGYSSGIPGYDIWIESVKSGKASSMGLAYNTGVWAECREFAVDFLIEAKQRLPKKIGPMIETSWEHYKKVSKNLNHVVKIFPFSVGMSSDPIGVSKKNDEAVNYLIAARNAEEKGLESLKSIFEVLSD